MACGETSDMNVFLPRVSFKEHSHSPHSPPAPSSLLTFADMVLALDSRSLTDSDTHVSSTASQTDKKPQADHTYASNKKHTMTTRSQVMRINSQQTHHPVPSDHAYVDTKDSRRRSEITSECAPLYFDPLKLSDDDCDSSWSSVSPLSEKRSSRKSVCSHSSPKFQDFNKNVKRSSSVENVSMLLHSHSGSPSNWPESSMHSPRKSCSSEEVNKKAESNPKSIKSEEKRKGGSSGQLHRLINDTFEFPSWPRKADHTYATASWDGMAVSHSLFEQELDHSVKMDKMEIETQTSNQNRTSKPRSHSQTDEHRKNYFVLQNQLHQKEDHTYVKQNSNNDNNTMLFDLHESTKTSDGYSCSTFPRQKSRDDHTYFTCNVRQQNDSPALQTDCKKFQMLSSFPPANECGDTNERWNSHTRLSSAKRDHNYFSSLR